MHWDTLGFLAYDYTKNTLRSRGLLCRMVDHIREHEMWQLQRKLFSRRNKAHNHLQLWIPRRQRHPSLWNSRVASLVTRFTVIWSASPQATKVFWREIINWERHRITATSEHFLGGFWSLPEKKLRLRRSSRTQNDHPFFGFKRITCFLGSKWHQRVGF